MYNTAATIHFCRTITERLATVAYAAGQNREIVRLTLASVYVAGYVCRRLLLCNSSFYGVNEFAGLFPRESRGLGAESVMFIYSARVFFLLIARSQSGA